VEISRPGNPSDECSKAHGVGVNGLPDVVATVLLACSSCAGDYEDPERTAEELSESDAEHEESEIHADTRREFPMEEE
jgi:hypothetical protein